MQPTPIARLERVSAFSVQHPGNLLWAPAIGATPHEIVFAAGSLIVGMHPVDGRQRHLQGHTRTVCALALSADGSRLASAEAGPGVAAAAAIRLWDYRQGRCLATVPGVFL
jgi:WD40 repeat protein